MAEENEIKTEENQPENGAVQEELQPSQSPSLEASAGQSKTSHSSKLLLLGR